MSVYLVNEKCPNAYWNWRDDATTARRSTTTTSSRTSGDTRTRENTHDLIYAYQSGALNESYSDIWGETIDLTTATTAIGGATQQRPCRRRPPTGGSALADRRGRARAARADCATCGTRPDVPIRDRVRQRRRSTTATASDGGGVHTNSGVPNHAYAMIVDGKTFNGVRPSQGIGFVKARSHLLPRDDDLPDEDDKLRGHANALEAVVRRPAARADEPSRPVHRSPLGAGDHVRRLRAGAQRDARRRDARDPPCGGGLILEPGAPEACEGARLSSRKTSRAGWTAGRSQSVGISAAEWPNYNWQTRRRAAGCASGPRGLSLPIRSPEAAGRRGDGDHSGKFSMTSPAIALPPARRNVELRFDHSVETEAGWDGGNLLYSTNGVVFQLVPPVRATLQRAEHDPEPHGLRHPEHQPEGGRTGLVGRQPGRRRSARGARRS